VAQQPPAAGTDLRRFPARMIPAGPWFRQHSASAGAWWFSSASGRFDLAAPRGTCYLASSGRAAVRERIGPDLAAYGLVPESLLVGRVVSRLRLPGSVRAANADSAAAANFGVTRELPVMVPYVVPQAWAQALDVFGFEALVASLRFTPGRALGVALFGDAGERGDWPTDPEPAPAAAIAVRMGIRVVATPRSSELTFIEPG